MLDLFAALDLDDKNEALVLAEKLSGHIKGLKVGPRLGFQLQEKDWSYLSELGEVFIDYKFYDIPSTVVAAVERCFHLGATFCTVHATNGLKCLKELAQLEEKLNQKREFKILVVSLLTSFDQVKNSLPLVAEKNTEVLVRKFVDVAYEAGLRNFVCSPHEVEGLKKKYENIFLVTPGVRLSDGASHDQSRIATPEWAWKKGADYLVAGRMLTQSLDLSETLQKVSEQWQRVKGQ